MRGKTIATLFFSLILLIGCNKPYETTGIITQQTETTGNKKIEQLKAMAQTNPVAAYDMGLRYLRGDGVAQSSYHAIEAFHAAASKGDLKAQIALGKIYITGIEEMGPDLQEAQKWLSIAAARGDKESGELLEQVKISREEEKQAEQAQEIDYGYRYDWYYYTPYRLYWHQSLWRRW